MFFMLTFSGSQFIEGLGLTSLVESIAFACLFIFLFWNYKSIRRAYKRKHILLSSIVVLICFEIGIILNNLTILRKSILLITMLIIWGCIYWGEGLYDKISVLCNISYTIIAAVVISSISAILSNHTIITTSEGIGSFAFGFTGGIVYKNYFAADLLAAYIGIFYYCKYYKKSTLNKILCFLLFIFIFLSGSRGGLVLFLIFYLVVNFEKLRNMFKTQKKLMLFLFVFVFAIAFIYAYQNIALKSATYILRIQGLTKYLDLFIHDKFHLFFGNSENVYDQQLDYVYTVRDMFGWDGSLEFAWLDIIIKNGIVGVIGYVIVFCRFFQSFGKCKNTREKSLIIAVTITLLASTLVETYAQSVHGVFGIYCYLLLASLHGNAFNLNCCGRKYKRIS